MLSFHSTYNKFSLCCFGAWGLPWSVADLLGVISLKKVDNFLSPSSYQMPISALLVVGFYTHPLSILGVCLGWACPSVVHTHCEFKFASVLLSLENTVFLKSLSTLWFYTIHAHTHTCTQHALHRRWGNLINDSGSKHQIPHLPG